MADVHSKETRSFNMSQIKGKNTKPEILVRKFLHSRGFRFRIHDASLPGKPDIVLKKFRLIIQVHGCFWHGHDGCKFYVIPKTRTDFWKKKIRRTKANDSRNRAKLTALGWNVIEVYECQLKRDKIEETLRLIEENIINANTNY